MGGFSAEQLRAITASILLLDTMSILLGLAGWCKLPQHFAGSNFSFRWPMTHVHALCTVYIYVFRAVFYSTGVCNTCLRVLLFRSQSCNMFFKYRLVSLSVERSQWEMSRRLS